MKSFAAFAVVAATLAACNASPPELVQIVAGAAHTCALRSDGRVFCWGLNDSGQLGDGTKTTRSKPVQVLLDDEVVSIAAGLYHTCAVGRTGVLHCWGANGAGQLGNGTLEDRPTPVLIGGIAVSSLALGDYHTCVVVDGDVKCWGWNYHLQTGNADPMAVVTRSGPTVISGATQVVAAGSATCALVNGSVWCWGDSIALGSSASLQEDSATPLPVLDYRGCGPCGNVKPPPFDTAVALYGGSQPCIVLDDGTVMCWGVNHSYVVPDVVSPLTIAAGFPPDLTSSYFADEQCGIMADGTLRCWAYPYDQCANLTCEIPVPRANALAGGGDCMMQGGNVMCVRHGCALTPSGAECWGDNTFGELGDGTTVKSTTPVAVTGL